MSNCPNYRAAGTITPSRFVKSNGTAYQVVQVTAITDLIVGVAQAGTRYPPGTPGDDGRAAGTGDPIKVHCSEGETCLLEAGGAFSAGAYLKADTSGRGVASALNEVVNTPFGAEALEAAVGTGDLVRVKILKFAARPA